mmetsp:Transcript_5266/g.11101  ORF Transcript_5266/g.11101 Transcript_5266/m.11101 type:complete len:542 (+) Transcript_5266:55-1680(+)
MLTEDGGLQSIRKRKFSDHQKVLFQSRIIFILFYVVMTTIHSRVMMPESRGFLFITASSHQSKMSEACLLLFNSHDEWRCMVWDDAGIARIVPFSSTSVPLHNTTVYSPLLSGTATFFSASAIIDWENNTISLDQDDRETYIISNLDQRSQVTQSIGIRSAIVVRVTTNDATTTSDGDQLSNKVFGTFGDKVNMSSQYKACSYGKQLIQPAPDTSVISNGVVEVKLNINAKQQTSSELESLAFAALEEILGKKFYLKYDHIMICLPPGFTDADVFFAHGYFKFPVSTYNDEQITYLSYQMHETGHNFGLSHAGLDTGSKIDLEYGDYSGYMGGSYQMDDEPEMCFNAPHSWEFGWYTNSHLTVNPFTRTNRWVGNIYGISKYVKSGARKTLVRIVGGEDKDYFVNFNQDTGMNTWTQLGWNQVLITYIKKNDPLDLYTTNVGQLYSGQRKVIKNYSGTGRNLHIKVLKIKNSARVSIVASPCIDKKKWRDKVFKGGCREVKSSNVKILERRCNSQARQGLPVWRYCLKTCQKCEELHRIKP